MSKKVVFIINPKAGVKKKMNIPAFIKEHFSSDISYDIIIWKNKDDFKTYEKIKEFFDKYGNKAIVFARFLPIFRTFAPVVAGIVEMNKKQFMFYNILGSILWSFTMILAGHYLYELFLNHFQIDLKASFHPTYYDYNSCPYSYYEISEK